MRYALLLIFLISGSLCAQEHKMRIIGQTKINDSLSLCVAELVIFNSTSHQICIKGSMSFWANLLSRDTIQLVNLSTDQNCNYYRLDVSELDKKIGGNEKIFFPIVLNSRTSFVATISFIYFNSCKNGSITFSVSSENNIDYNLLLEKFNNHQKWNTDPKIFQDKKILLSF